MKKLVYLEALRGIAALVVVFHHYFAAFYPVSVFGARYRAHGNWEKLFTTTPLGITLAGYSAVCLFFILSGYVLSFPYFGESPKDSNSLLAALIKRPFRLLGLVVVSEIISFCLLCVSQYYNASVSEISFSTPWFHDQWNRGDVRVGSFISDLLTRPFAAGAAYNPPLWTIELELYGSFITFIFILLFRKSRWRYPAYLLVLLYFHGQLYQGFIFGIIFADVSQNHRMTVTSCSKGALAYPILLLGVLLASYPILVPRAELKNTFFGAFPQLPGLAGGYSMLGGILVFLAVVLDAGFQKILSRQIFAFLGRVSYALYAFHFLILGSFSSWLFLKLNLVFGYHAGFALSFLLSLVLLFLVAYFASKHIDEPMTCGANRIAKLWLQFATRISGRVTVK